VRISFVFSPDKVGIALWQFHPETVKGNKVINPEDPAVPSEMPLGFYFTGVNPVE
jgi:hypothetical protein